MECLSMKENVCLKRCSNRAIQFTSCDQVPQEEHTTQLGCTLNKSKHINNTLNEIIQICMVTFRKIKMCCPSLGTVIQSTIVDGLESTRLSAAQVTATNTVQVNMSRQVFKLGTTCINRALIMNSCSDQQSKNQRGTQIM